jgi:hypothetical protein
MEKYKSEAYFKSPEEVAKTCELIQAAKLVKVKNPKPLRGAHSFLTGKLSPSKNEAA